MLEQWHLVTIWKASMKKSETKKGILGWFAELVCIPTECIQWNEVCIPIFELYIPTPLQNIYEDLANKYFLREISLDFYPSRMRISSDKLMCADNDSIRITWIQH